MRMTDKQMIDVLNTFADCEGVENCRKCDNLEKVCGDGVAEIIFYREAASRIKELSAFAEGKALSMNEYQHKAARTINQSLNGEQKLFHALHGLAGEVGEIHSLFQKELQGHAIDPEKLKKEVGDLLWFVAELCTVSGWTLEEIARLNIAKLEKRYPEGFSAERSIHREGTED